MIEVRFMSDFSSDPAALAPAPYDVPIETLRGLVRTLPRPAPDAPAATWQGVVQGGLDAFTALDARDGQQAQLAVQVIAAGAAATDAYRLAFAPGATAAEAAKQRASAVALTRAGATVMRALVQQRKQPPVPVRDWGAMVGELAADWQADPGRPAEAVAGVGAKPAAGQPEEIVRWFDEVPDDELAAYDEKVRRLAAGEPLLPEPPGPRRIYLHKPDDYARRWKPDPKNFEHYPGWENMSMAERRAFFGYTYDGPVAPVSMLSPESQAAAAAEEAAAAAAGTAETEQDQPEVTEPHTP
jgi:hypothetical protein